MGSSDIVVRRLSGARAERNCWRFVRELCCDTGDNGDPVAPGRREFFSRVWIEPYEKLLPEWTYVAEDDGVVVGYLTGCPDTAKFTKAKRWRSTLPLLAAIALGRYRGTSDAGAFLRRATSRVPSLEERVSGELKQVVESDYPAHLHMNVAARHRGSGIGRRLIERYVGDLRAAAVPGVHLFCGPEPAGFYSRQGFRELRRATVGRTAVLLMVKRC